MFEQDTVFLTTQTRFLLSTLLIYYILIKVTKIFYIA